MGRLSSSRSITLKANRPDLVNHDAIKLAVACNLKPERPRPERARQRADYCHVGLVHRDRTDHDARTTFLLFVSSPRRIEITPIDTNRIICWMLNSNNGRAPAHRPKCLQIRGPRPKLPGLLTSEQMRPQS